MLPLDFKIDKNGLFYLEDINDLYEKTLFLDKREYKDDYFASAFFRIDGTDEYVIKKPITLLTRPERKLYYEFLLQLAEKQKEIPEVDFPIGYYQEKRKLEGQIPRYYENGISLDNITKEEDINIIGKYYPHDEDNIHNLFLIFDEIITRLEQMYEHGVYYTDVNDGNFVIWNEQVKVIDFDPYYVTFTDRYPKLTKMLDRYIMLINLTLDKYQLSGGEIENIQNFKEAKRLALKMENNVRKNIQRW